MKAYLECKDSLAKKKAQVIEKEFDDDETHKKMKVFLHKLEER